jgi:hypothetical protein
VAPPPAASPPAWRYNSRDGEVGGHGHARRDLAQWVERRSERGTGGGAGALISVQELDRLFDRALAAGSLKGAGTRVSVPKQGRPFPDRAIGGRIRGEARWSLEALFPPEGDPLPYLGNPPSPFRAAVAPIGARAARLGAGLPRNGVPLTPEGAGPAPNGARGAPNRAALAPNGACLPPKGARSSTQKGWLPRTFRLIPVRGGLESLQTVKLGAAGSRMEAPQCYKRRRPRSMLAKHRNSALAADWDSWTFNEKRPARFRGPAVFSFGVAVRRA